MKTTPKPAVRILLENLSLWLKEGKMSNEDVKAALDGLNFSEPILVRTIFDANPYQHYDSWTTPGTELLGIGDEHLIELAGERLLSMKNIEPNGVRSSNDRGDAKTFIHELMKFGGNDRQFKKAYSHYETLLGQENVMEITKDMGVLVSDARKGPLAELFKDDTHDSEYLLERVREWHDFARKCIKTAWAGFRRSEDEITSTATNAIGELVNDRTYFDFDKIGIVKAIVEFGVVPEPETLIDIFIVDDERGSDLLRTVERKIIEDQKGVFPYHRQTRNGGRQVLINTLEKLRESTFKSFSTRIEERRDSLARLMLDEKNPNPDTRRVKEAIESFERLSRSYQAFVEIFPQYASASRKNDELFEFFKTKEHKCVSDDNLPALLKSITRSFENVPLIISLGERLRQVYPSETLLVGFFREMCETQNFFSQTTRADIGIDMAQMILDIADNKTSTHEMLARIMRENDVGVPDIKAKVEMFSLTKSNEPKRKPRSAV